MQAGVPSDAGRLEALVDLGGLLELHNLLGSLQQAHMDV